MTYPKLAVLVGLCLLIVGCSSRQSPTTEAASIEWRLKSLEESFLNFREEQRKLADKQDDDAKALQARIDAVEAALAALKPGTVIDAPDAVVDDMGSSGESGGEEDGWVTDLSPEEGVSSSAKPDGAVAESGEEKPWATVPTAPVLPEPTVSKPDKKSAKKSRGTASAKGLYDTALTQYNNDDFVGARGSFDEFLKKYPKNELVPNALYWKGETYYSQKDYAQSILAFKEVTSRYPKHAKSAAALLKIGMAYDRVGDPDNALFYLRALVEDFPRSGPARLGQKELKRLGG